MAERQDLLTALEACRPGSADRDLPELAELKAAIQGDAALASRAEAVQRWDESLRKTLLSGEVPSGLEERVLAFVRAASDPPPGAGHESRAAEPSRAGTVRRRRFWISVTVAATVAALATGVAFWSLLTDSEPITSTTIHEQAARWCDALSPTAWREANVPREFPFPPNVVSSPDAWQPVSVPDVEAAVAYRLPSPSPSVRRITVLVLKAEAAGLAPFPPRHPYMTMDRLVAAWQIGGNVYVLVIQGDDLGVLQDVYQRYVDTHIHAA